MPDAAKTKLIVHIGAGKTGSSSIQHTLRENQKHLAGHGMKYLGLMLEHAAEELKQPWNRAGASKELIAMSHEAAAEQIYGVLHAEMTRQTARGTRAAIWSNEWMFTRHDWFIPALKRIEAEGTPVEIICYIRRHDKWARSAYAQWGIKHKTNKGPVRPFSEWSKGRGFKFYPAVQPWVDAFPTTTRLFNFDAAGEVVSHFCKAIGYTPEQIIQENVTPPHEVMAAWAVFNSRFDGEVLPIKFQQAVRASGIMEPDSLSLAEMTTLYPTEADLTRIREANGQDRAVLNKLLTEQGEEPLADSAYDPRAAEVDPWKMNVMLLQMVFGLQQQVAGLRQRVKALEDDA